MLESPDAETIRRRHMVTVLPAGGRIAVIQRLVPRGLAQFHLILQESACGILQGLAELVRLVHFPAGQQERSHAVGKTRTATAGTGGCCHRSRIQARQVQFRSSLASGSVAAIQCVCRCLIAGPGEERRVGGGCHEADALVCAHQVMQVLCAGRAAPTGSPTTTAVYSTWPAGCAGVPYAPQRSVAAYRAQ